jgi:hypothetical protein
MATGYESQEFARQLRLYRMALWQALAALVCVGLATARPAWLLGVPSAQVFLEWSALLFYVGNTFTLYRLAVAVGWDGKRVACWLFLLAPFGSLVALVLLAPIRRPQRVSDSAARGN